MRTKLSIVLLSIALSSSLVAEEGLDEGERFKPTQAVSLAKTMSKEPTQSLVYESVPKMKIGVHL